MLPTLRGLPAHYAGYHSAQTIGLLYQRTHADAVVRTGARIEPEEAIARLRDLRVVLDDLGFS
jgi:hypothetical protein